MLAALRTMGRDNARTPMQWDASSHGGFTTGKPWIEVNPNHVSINAAAAVADPESVFHHYRRLIALRHVEPAVAHGDFTMLLPGDPAIYAFTRRLGDVELLVVANLSGSPVPVELLDDAAWKAADVLSTNLLPGEDVLPGGLQPWESRVLRRMLEDV